MRVGEIVQINPDIAHESGPHPFAGALMIVTHPKSWGAEGYVQDTNRKVYPFRCIWDDMEPTGGVVPWLTRP